VATPYLNACPEPDVTVTSTTRFRGSRVALLRAAAAVVLAVTMTALGAGAAHANVRGPDVSSYEHDNGQSMNWGALRWVGGASFAFIKATEGGGYSNPYFGADIAEARKHGLIRGAYHFARPSGGDNREITRNATAEAVQFGHAIGSLDGPGNLAPVLDLEDAGSLDQRQLQIWVSTFLKKMTKLTGRMPIIYTGVSFWQESMGNSNAYAAYPLWLASYGVSRPTMVGGWTSYTFWQYSETSRISGTVGDTDMSVFNGSFAKLKAMTVTPASTRAAAAAAASARSASARKVAAAKAKTAADLTTLQLFNRADPRTADPGHGDKSASRSSVRSWLGVYSMDGSRAISGY
jgi:GH25 family lysozyme M1 (1,4-beta-N-acetylmuramidase)